VSGYYVQVNESLQVVLKDGQAIVSTAYESQTNCCDCPSNDTCPGCVDVQMMFTISGAAENVIGPDSTGGDGYYLDGDPNGTYGPFVTCDPCGIDTGVALMMFNEGTGEYENMGNIGASASASGGFISAGVGHALLDGWNAGTSIDPTGSGCAEEEVPAGTYTGSDGDVSVSITVESVPDTRPCPGSCSSATMIVELSGFPLSSSGTPTYAFSGGDPNDTYTGTGCNNSFTKTGVSYSPSNPYSSGSSHAFGLVVTAGVVAGCGGNMVVLIQANDTFNYLFPIHQEFPVEVRADCTNVPDGTYECPITGGGTLTVTIAR
jgi:hypothetical protein